MTGNILKKLAELGIQLPAGPAPVANYVPFVKSGNLVFVSGQLPLTPSGMDRYTGRVGETISLETAREAARTAAINCIAVLNSALEGDLDRLVRVVKITGFVSATPEFRDHPEVVNGASDLFVEVFGDAGRHARAAVGAGSLPRNVVVEVEAVFEIR